MRAEDSISPHHRDTAFDLADALGHIKEGRGRVGIGLHVVEGLLDDGAAPADTVELEALFHLLRWLAEACTAAMGTIAERLDGAEPDDGGSP
jgi:hypothetical protein